MDLRFPPAYTRKVICTMGSSYRRVGTDVNNPAPLMADKASRSNQHQSCSTSSIQRILIFLTVFFLAFSLALAGYIIYLKQFEQKGTSRENEILRRYPEFFRTPQQQLIFEKKYYAGTQDKIIAEEVNGTSLDFCRFSCAINGSYKFKRHAVSPLFLHRVFSLDTFRNLRKRHAGKNVNIYHSCCISSQLFAQPTVSKTISGEPVEVVQLPGHRQYFPTETCQQDSNCFGCRCSQDHVFMMALVNPPGQKNSISTQFIQVLGCCKCLNSFPNQLHR